MASPYSPKVAGSNYCGNASVFLYVAYCTVARFVLLLLFSPLRRAFAYLSTELPVFNKHRKIAQRERDERQRSERTNEPDRAPTRASASSSFRYCRDHTNKMATPFPWAIHAGDFDRSRQPFVFLHQPGPVRSLDGATPGGNRRQA